MFGCQSDRATDQPGCLAGTASAAKLTRIARTESEFPFRANPCMLDVRLSPVGPGRVKTFSIFQELNAAGRDPRRRDHLSIFLAASSLESIRRNLGPR
jgi:hypothetical protein